MIQKTELCCIDEGHGVYPDIGADGRYNGGCLEEDIINAVCRNLKVHLQNLGQAHLFTRPSEADSVQDSLFKRIDSANMNNCSLFVSIHANATPTGYGTEIYTYNGEAIEEAKIILSEMEKIGFTNRGVKDGNNLAVISNTNARAMLIEICFCDNPNDVALFNKHVDRISRIIATAITGINCIDLSPPLSNVKNKLYKVQVGAFSNRGGAAELLTKLKEHGFSGFIKEE